MIVCVMGAGTMGSGIAQVFAQAGHTVALCDINTDFAARGKSNIAKGLNRLVSKGKMEQSVCDEILGRITTGLIDIAAGSDLVIEAIMEKMELKKELFKNLEGICGPDTIFASNTSSLSVTEMALGLSRSVVGMHFFNPAPVMALVEVIAGLNTPAALIKQIKELAVSLGKTPVEVKEAPGFVVNRLLIPMINEGIGVLADGVASAEDIDTAMKLGANHPIGPLALSDLIGNDIVLSIMEVLYNETGDSKYRPHPLLRKMVRGGLLGRKTKKGFFVYEK